MAYNEGGEKMLAQLTAAGWGLKGQRIEKFLLEYCNLKWHML